MVSKTGDFHNRVSLTPPGSKTRLTVIRNGMRKVLEVKIGNLEDDDRVLAQSSVQSADELGLTVQTITSDLEKQFDVKSGHGVVVTDVKQASVASMAGIVMVWSLLR